MVLLIYASLDLLETSNLKRFIMIYKYSASEKRTCNESFRMRWKHIENASKVVDKKIYRYSESILVG